MLRYAMALLTVLALAPFVPAADKPAKAEKSNKLIGTWTHTVNDCAVTFKFEAHKVVVKVDKKDEQSLALHGAYGVTDNVVFGYATKVEKTGTNEGPEKGDLFSFTYKVDGDKLTIGDLNGSNPPSDPAKALIQGEYQRMNK